MSYNYQHPVVIRHIIWNRYFGNNNTGYCLICNMEIDFNSYQYGYVISKKDGGKSDSSNIKPICHNCNDSIGSQNMESFMKSRNYKKSEYWNN